MARMCCHDVESQCCERCAEESFRRWVDEQQARDPEIPIHVIVDDFEWLIPPRQETGVATLNKTETTSVGDTIVYRDTEVERVLEIDCCSCPRQGNNAHYMYLVDCGGDTEWVCHLDVEMVNPDDSVIKCLRDGTYYSE